MHHDRLRSPLSRARGLGAAKEGFHHWWLQRLTAIALIPLSIWFMVSMICTIMGSTRFEFAAWLVSPWNTLLLSTLLAVMLTHARLGIQVVLEDYVHSEGKKLVMLLANQFIFIGMTVLSIFAVVKLHFFGI